MYGIRTACKCILGLWIGCSMLQSTSAQVVMMPNGASHASAVNFGQPRIVGFQPASGMAGVSVANGMYVNSRMAMPHPMAGTSASVVGFRSANSLHSHRFVQPGMYSGSPNLNGFNAGFVTTGSQFGRIVRYRYRVPVYGVVNSCNVCAPATQP